MESPVHTVKVIDRSRLAPPSGSVEEISLHLTFFDVIWLQIPPVQRIFFFELPDSKTNFLMTHLPNLKRSLSLALQHFYPLAGTLTLSPQTGEFEIHYADGDSVLLTIAESDSNFHGLVADQPKDAVAFHPLVPELPTSDLISFRVTIFADSGFSIGLTVDHVAGDGSSIIHFVKYWASICRLGSESCLNLPLPLHDRTLVSDPSGLKQIFLDQMSKWEEKLKLVGVGAQQQHMVRATFVMSRANIDELRQRVAMSRARVEEEDCSENRPLHLSSFVLTCAYVWVCLTKARGDVGSETTVHCGFAVDCRSRLDPPIPVAYFGNCIGACFARAKGSDIAGGDDDGFAVACKAIGRAIQRLDDDGGALEGADQWLTGFVDVLAQGERILSVAGSPRLRVYDTDFGFGRPCKVEVRSIEETGAMSLAERRDGGGIEVGLALPECEMERFASLYKEGLKGHYPCI